MAAMTKPLIEMDVAELLREYVVAACNYRIWPHRSLAIQVELERRITSNLRETPECATFRSN